MKKSDHYRLAQIAVLAYTGADLDEKLEVLQSLIANEQLELFLESKAKEGNHEAV